MQCCVCTHGCLPTHTHALYLGLCDVSYSPTATCLPRSACGRRVTGGTLFPSWVPLPTLLVASVSTRANNCHQLSTPLVTVLSIATKWQQVPTNVKKWQHVSPTIDKCLRLSRS